jgi:hypothetical protein
MVSPVLEWWVASALGDGMGAFRHCGTAFAEKILRRFWTGCEKGLTEERVP